MCPLQYPYQENSWEEGKIKKVEKMKQKTGGDQWAKFTQQVRGGGASLLLDVGGDRTIDVTNMTQEQALNALGGSQKDEQCEQEFKQNAFAYWWCLPKQLGGKLHIQHQ